MERRSEYKPKTTAASTYFTPSSSQTLHFTPITFPPHSTPLHKTKQYNSTLRHLHSLAGARTRHTQPVRVLHGMWWTFAVILIYTYTGTLIAFLTVPRLTSLINSLEELANQKNVLWTYRAKTAHETLFAVRLRNRHAGLLLRRAPDRGLQVV
uniref:Ionotropic glutamate receptor C-terminal domain-containing protein n=1 Tax=Scylla olivacea TaxID=85551 RepID=A0A0P4WDM1_SCYOL